MRGLATRNPRAFGVLVTLAGVMVFVPDALVMWLIGGDMLALAVWRGLLAGGLLFAGNLLLAPRSLPGRGEWFDRAGVLVMLCNAGSVLTWSAAMQHTSVANALLLLATAPFLAAVLSWIVLRERVDAATALAIAAIFGGVAIIASGSLGSGKLLGDMFALANACTIAGYYVTLRLARGRNMLPHLALGTMLGGVLAVPFAEFAPVSAGQLWLILLSGAVIVPGAISLLMLGPRYLPAPEVSMITMLEIILGPLLVWAVLGENPGQASLVGGAVILLAVGLHTARRLRAPGVAA